jgi:hypothetical protein
MVSSIELAAYTTLRNANLGILQPLLGFLLNLDDDGHSEAEVHSNAGIFWGLLSDCF